ncbi:MAG: hypothetical protein E7553_03475 [Ruminococcaceae bacterium]|nr:hypothetical protein [Oscillospiraceae bacterium]
MKKKDKKKEKITYIDDGRSLSDLSGRKPAPSYRDSGTSSRFSDIWHTYWGAVRMMFLPMLAVIGCLIVLFIILKLVFWLA